MHLKSICMFLHHICLVNIYSGEGFQTFYYDSGCVSFPDSFPSWFPQTLKATALLHGREQKDKPGKLVPKKRNRWLGYTCLIPLSVSPIRLDKWLSDLNWLHIALRLAEIQIVTSQTQSFWKFSDAQSH